MPRWLSHLTIAAYLSVLSLGIVAHALTAGVTSHPMMYYIVWDMFCGWTAYELRYHAIAEGESGQFYQLSPSPWGDFTPYGPYSRLHYDSLKVAQSRIVTNTLRQTDHEPIVKVYVVEEAWNKKFNVPEFVWKQLHDEPQEPLHYYSLWTTFHPDGTLIANNPSILQHWYYDSISDNPRLEADQKRTRAVLAIDPSRRQFETGRGWSEYDMQERSSSARTATPLGN
jgi:hypothetical protein